MVIFFVSAFPEFQTSLTISCSLKGQEVILYNFLRIHNELASDNTIKTCKGSYFCELDIMCWSFVMSIVVTHEYS